MKFVVRIVVALAVPVFAGWLAGKVRADADQADVDQVDHTFFETRVRPVLIEHCFACHDADTQESGLRVDSRAALLQGGERGPALVPGQPEKSLLIHAINHSVELQMPEGDKLSARAIKDLTQWVREGAPWPGAATDSAPPPKPEQEKSPGELFSSAEKTYWAFQPPQRPSLPDVKDRSWIQSDLDYFILARLEQAGLRPAPPASKQALIRRAYFDLIGLPPSRDQVQAFLNDSSHDAFARVVDQLLASPHYGERWGRHWLDVARYADSNGLDENIAFEYIYKYRDWVVTSLNRDLPFNQFVLHQLAGDLVEQQPHETADDYIHRVQGIGFLAVGPKMIADDDPMKKDMDVIDEQLSTVCQAFMALTVGCARCHDHKFDPIPTWDYYAMAGIFKSIDTLDHLGVVAPIVVRELKPHRYEERMARFQQRWDELQAQRTEILRASAKPYLQLARQNSARYLQGVWDFGLFANVGMHSASLAEKKAKSDKEMLSKEAIERISKIAQSIAVDATPSSGSGTLDATLLRQWIEFLSTQNLADPQNAWHSLTQLPPDADSTRVTLAIESLLKNGVVQELLDRPTGPLQLPPDAERWIGDAHAVSWKKLQATIAAWELERPQLARIMGVKENPPENLPVMLRGNYLTPGEPTERQFLRIIDGETKRPLQTQQSGRLELAQWLTAPQHPLTSRVIVNRIWRWRFGRGIVPSVDNFGRLGERPTHPDLLDWLACTFVEQDQWSWKSLHRRMMLSATYQMSSQFDESNAQQDPANELWWRFPRRRLEAEGIRDAILTVSQQIDRRFGGSLMPIKDREYVTGTASKTQDYGLPRRSLYQPIYRSAVYDVLEAFDFPDPALSVGDRKESIVAPQALLMLNSELTRQAARQIATALVHECNNVAERTSELYWRVVQREPRPQEITTVGQYLGALQRSWKMTLSEEGPATLESREIQIWESVARALLASNEFLYLE